MTRTANLTRVALWLVAAGVCIGPTPLRAQAITCNQAKSILLASNSNRADLFKAATHILGCPGDAPATIATGLRRATLNTVQDTVLKWDAYLLFDKRLLDSVRTLAVDQTQPLAKRQFYLQLLTRYASPGAAVDLAAATSGNTQVVVGGGNRDGVTGSQPIALSDRERARATIYAMYQNDPDAGLRQIANLVYHQLLNWPK